jgi:galactonate dehydratase
MRVTGITTFLVQPPSAKTALFLKVDTDAGIHGWGEAYTLTGREQALERLVQDLGGYLVGRDPFQIRHFTHVMWRDVSIKRGGFDFYCALSGLEIALWDIVGKALNTPVYNLLGGPCREKMRVYGQPSGPRGDGGLTDLAQRARNTVERGLTALKFDPFPGAWRMIVDKSVERTAIERVRTVREAVGPDIDVLIEVHRRLAPMHAVRVAQAIEQYNPFWFEEPTPADDLISTAYVRTKTTIPIVAGEALYTRAEFREVFERQAADIINPDICNVGGLLEMRDIASMAEAHSVALAPHGNNSTTIGLAASLQVAACVPNFLIMEYPVAWEPFANELAVNPYTVENGMIALPTGPGLGMELDEAALAKYPYQGGRGRTLAVPADEFP